MSDKAEQTLQRLGEYHRTIEALSRIGTEPVPPDRLMHHVVAQVARVTHIERAKILRYRREHGDLFIEAGVGWRDGVVGHVALAADHRSPAGRAYQTGTPVLIQNFAEARDFRMPELLRQHGIISLLNVPVTINGFTWGVLEVDSTQPGSFDEWDVSFLSILANVMGACLALYETAQKNLEAMGERARERAQSDIVLRELQHRVKNNLQIIIAFLSMKMRNSSVEVREKLDSVIGRVQAIAIAHDMLAHGKATSNVNFDTYLRSLCSNIDPQRADIAIEVEAEPAQIPLDRAVPAGLVVNELVTNSIKYAFGNGQGRIRVHFAPVSNSSEACVTVEDNGKGLPLPPQKGLGLTLVEAFAQQIQGRVEYRKADIGSHVMLCFPITA